MKIETFAARDRLRFAMTLGLVRSTSAQQLRTVIEGVEGVLWAQPKLFPSSAVVRFEKFGPSSLDVDVVAYFETRDWAEFQKIRQELLLEFYARARDRQELALLPNGLRRDGVAAP
jgi:MscS family membrane protein